MTFPFTEGREWVNLSEGWVIGDPVADAAWFEAVEASLHEHDDADIRALNAADLVSDYVAGGMLPAVPDPTSLSVDIPAGRAYLGGLGVQKDAESHTYTAQADTYVDLLASGAFGYAEVANGAAAPAVAAGALRLFKVVTDASAITEVTDLRDLEPTLRGSPDLSGYARISGDPADGDFFEWSETDGAMVPVAAPSGGGGGGVTRIAEAAMSASQTVVEGAVTTLPFNTRTLDPGNLINIASYRYVAPESGVYEFDVEFGVVGVPANAQLQFWFSINADGERYYQFWIASSAQASSYLRVTGRKKFSLNLNDYVEVLAYGSSFGGPAPTVVGGTDKTMFSGKRLSA